MIYLLNKKESILNCLFISVAKNNFTVQKSEKFQISNYYGSLKKTTINFAFRTAPLNVITENELVTPEIHEWNPAFYVSAIFILFAIGLFGFVFNRSHIILTIISGELMLLAAFLNFVHGGYAQGDPKGNIYALLLLVIAAAESAIGLALIVKIRRLRKTSSLASMRFLRG